MTGRRWVRSGGEGGLGTVHVEGLARGPPVADKQRGEGLLRIGILIWQC